MPHIRYLQANGHKWYVTHCEVIIPIGATEGMTSRTITKTLLQCQNLSRRFSDYLHHCNNVGIPCKDDFDSVTEFETYEMRPELGYHVRPPKQMRTQQAGFVYLASGNGSFKIGRSRSLESREHYLTVKLPFPVKIVHRIKSDDCVQVERYWHDRFAKKRIRGEWFNLTENDVAKFLACAEM